MRATAVGLHLAQIDRRLGHPAIREVDGGPGALPAAKSAPILRETMHSAGGWL
jgi:hypothetical protein